LKVRIEELERVKVLKPFNFVITVENEEEAKFIHDNILIQNKYYSEEEREKFGDLTRKLIGTFYKRISASYPENFE